MNRRFGHAPRRAVREPARLDSSSAHGFTLVEVVVAITVLAFVLASVAVGMGSALSLARNNRNRIVAANLASLEMDRVRSSDFDSLAVGLVESSRTLDGVTYTIRRNTQWLGQENSPSVCGPPADIKLAFKAIAVTVLWPDMAGAQPVNSQTILGVPGGSTAAKSHLAVKVTDRLGQPALSHTVTIVGPSGTRSAVTDADGCAFFATLAPGEYTASLNTLGYVDGQGTQAPSKTVGVAGGEIASVEFQYDRAATLVLTPEGLTGYAAPSGIGATVANTGLLLGSQKYAGGGGGSQTSCASPGPQTVLSSADTLLAQQAPSTNLGTSNIYYLTRSQNSNRNARALVKFNLPTIPEGCEVTLATLRLYASSAASGRTLQAYRVASSWSETGATWNNQPATTGSPVTRSSGTGWLEFTVTSHVQAMYSSNNDGFLIKDALESGSSSARDVWIHPREGANDPELVVTLGDAAATNCSSQTVTATVDALVSQPFPNYNFGNFGFLRVRSQSGQNARSLVKFPLPAVPAGCSLSQATLRLYANSSAGGRSIQALQAVEPWAETSVTWNNQPTTTGSPATVSAGAGWNEWNVTSQVQAMYTGANEGFVVRDASEDGSPSATQDYSSSEGSNPPQLGLTFVGGPGGGPITASGLFPYTDGYYVWAGTCADADPEAQLPDGGGPVYPGAQRDPAAASNPGQSTPVIVSTKSVDVSVRLNDVDNPPVEGASVRAVHAPDPGCPSGATLQLGLTDAAGVVQTALPYGEWAFEVIGRTPVGAWPQLVLAPTSFNPASVQMVVN